MVPRDSHVLSFCFLFPHWFVILLLLQVPGMYLLDNTLGGIISTFYTLIIIRIVPYIFVRRGTFFLLFSVFCFLFFLLVVSHPNVCLMCFRSFPPYRLSFCFVITILYFCCCCCCCFLRALCVCSVSWRVFVVPLICLCPLPPPPPPPSPPPLFLPHAPKN